MNSPIKCFLIDNDIEDQEIFLLALKKVSPSITCEFADDGPIAIKRFTSDNLFIPDIIFIDMNMPFMNGTECLQEIRKLNHLNAVPIYIYSTFGDPELMDQAKNLGAADFILKPSSFLVLKESLEKLLLSINPGNHYISK
ncbi:MAG: response regulator [Bacteroidota bacterium]